MTPLPLGGLEQTSQVAVVLACIFRFAQMLARQAVPQVKGEWHEGIEFVEFTPFIPARARLTVTGEDERLTVRLKALASHYG